MLSQDSAHESKSYALGSMKLISTTTVSTTTAVLISKFYCESKLNVSD